MAVKAVALITLTRVNDGATGPQGAAGTSVASMTQQYYMSDSKTEQTGGSWVESMPTWSNGKYLWTRYKVIYKNPTSTVYTTPVCDSSWEAVNEERTDRQLKSLQRFLKLMYQILHLSIIKILYQVSLLKRKRTSHGQLINQLMMQRMR